MVPAADACTDETEKCRRHCRRRLRSGGVRSSRLAQTGVACANTGGAVRACEAFGALDVVGKPKSFGQVAAVVGKILPCGCSQSKKQSFLVFSRDMKYRKYCKALLLEGEKIMWMSVFILDLAVVIAMMLFMESIGGKRPHRSRMPHPQSRMAKKHTR